MQNNYESNCILTNLLEKYAACSQSTPYNLLLNLKLNLYLYAILWYPIYSMSMLAIL